jgi:hypothetical protein
MGAACRSREIESLGREPKELLANWPREAGDSVLVKTDRGLHERATRERKICRDTKLDTGTRN